MIWIFFKRGFEMSNLDKLVLNDESIDDLQLKGLKLIQRKMLLDLALMLFYYLTFQE